MCEETFELLRNNLEKERNLFKESFISKSPADVYNEHYRIGFYEEFYEMLMSDFIDEHISDNEVEWLAKKEMPLACLYECWLGCDGAMSYDWDDMLDWIKLIYKEHEEWDGDYSGLL